MDADRIELPDQERTAGIIRAAIVRSYMKATNVDSWLLLNFAARALTVKRVGRAHPTPS
jgi:hypothetical protein